MHYLPFPLKIPFPKFSCRRSFCEFWILNPKPQRDATISSSNMKPVKWVKWIIGLSYKNEDEPEG